MSAEAAGASLSPEAVAHLESLHKLQTEYETQHRGYLREMRELEKKYEGIYAGVYAKRREILTGVDGGIPKFWLTAMKNSSTLSQFIEEHDEPVLEYLRDVTASTIGDFEGFKLEFHFAASNPYFENAVLSKEFHVSGMLPSIKEPGADGEEEDDEEDVKKIVGTTINWKTGKNVTVKLVKKRGKGGKKARPAKTVEEELPSFFRFFETPDMMTPEEMEADEEAAMEFVQQIQQEMMVAEFVKDRLVPEAVNFFTGEASEEDDEYDEDEEDEDEEDDDEEGDEEEEEEEEEESEEEEKPKKGGKGGKKGGKDDADAAAIQDAMAKSFAKGGAKPAEGGGAAAPGGEQKPECKNQ